MVPFSLGHFLQEDALRPPQLTAEIFLKILMIHIVDMVLLQNCRKDKIFLETMIVATIVMIVATIKKIAKFGNFTG